MLIISFQSEKEYSSRIPITSPILITPLSNHLRCSSSESIHSSNLSDLVGGEFQIGRSRRSSLGSSVPHQRRVRFHSRDFVRRRSSTKIDLPSHIHGKRLLPIRSESYSARTYTEKSAAKTLDEQKKYPIEQTKNLNKKKSISLHSMTNTKNMRLPPTATVVIQKTSKPSFHSTASTNQQIKKTLSNRNSTNSSSQRPLKLHSIPKKSKVDTQPTFDFNIRSLHQHDDDDGDDCYYHQYDDISTNE